MKTQPEALRLADLLEMGSIWQDQERAAAELRRLHAQRDALLAALKKMRIKYGEYACSVCEQADAAIRAAEGEKK